VVATTDLLVEGRHFRRDWSTANDVGHKAAARNFADIAAMGAVPTALLVGFATPPDLELTWADGLMAGLREECGEVGAGVVGGDVAAADVITLAVTALGDLQGRDPVTLGGARVGDVVALTGRVGWADAGFAVLTRGFRSPVQVVAAHRRPEVPYAEGPRAADLGATSMTDISDGLVADLGGDDYALVATFPKGTDLPDAWAVIGAVTEGEGVRVDGRRWPVGGHEHFR
jgi:thiamine-monophosphate kinase